MRISRPYISVPFGMPSYRIVRPDGGSIEETDLQKMDVSTRSVMGKLPYQVTHTAKNMTVRTPAANSKHRGHSVLVNNNQVWVEHRGMEQAAKEAGLQLTTIDLTEDLSDQK